LWVEHDNASVKDATLSAVTAAAKLGEVHLLVAGASGAWPRLPRRSRVSISVTFDDAAFNTLCPRMSRRQVADPMRGYDAFVAPSPERQEHRAARGGLA
jgi:electron transfer flavoprotein alpha subunit